MKSAPPIRLIYEWVDGLREGARQVSNAYEAQGGVFDVQGGVLKTSALQVQAAVIASLVTGRETPPCRLSVIKSVVHPSCVSMGGCLDADCVLGRGCKGNRVEVVSVEDGSEVIKIIAPHHKTEDSNQRQGPLDITLPPGTLSNLMLFWIKYGWFCLEDKRKTPHLFTSAYGCSFNDSTFCQYWKRIMQSAPHTLPYFPPNLARTSFVEEWTASE